LTGGLGFWNYSLDVRRPREVIEKLTEEGLTKERPAKRRQKRGAGEKGVKIGETAKGGADKKEAGKREAKRGAGEKGAKRGETAKGGLTKKRPTKGR
jgi:hypothetical protein